MVPSMEIGDGVVVTVQALTDAEVLEEIRGNTVVVEEDDEKGTAEDEVPLAHGWRPPRNGERA